MNDIVIETRGLTKKYGEQISVSNLSLHVRKGRIYGLLGRNGAGKTTTMRMLLGLTTPSSGEVEIFGKPLRGNEKKILPRIGSLIESPGFYPNLTGTENLQIFATLRGLKNPKYVKNALEVVNLPYRDKKLFSQYSLGMKQRLAIALSVMHNPELLILDEPINGLDPIGIAEMRAFIRELCDAAGKNDLDLQPYPVGNLSVGGRYRHHRSRHPAGRGESFGTGRKERKIYTFPCFRCGDGGKPASEQAGYPECQDGECPRTDGSRPAAGYRRGGPVVCGGRAFCL